MCLLCCWGVFSIRFPVQSWSKVSDCHSLYLPSVLQLPSSLLVHSPGALVLVSCFKYPVCSAGWHLNLYLYLLLHSPSSILVFLFTYSTSPLGDLTNISSLTLSKTEPLLFPLTFYLVFCNKWFLHFCSWHRSKSWSHLYFFSKVPIKAMVFPVVMYRCGSWTMKEGEC